MKNQNYIWILLLGIVLGVAGCYQIILPKDQIEIPDKDQFEIFPNLQMQVNFYIELM